MDLSRGLTFLLYSTADLMLVELRKVDEVLVLDVRSSSPRRGLTKKMAQTRPSK